MALCDVTEVGSYDVTEAEQARVKRKASKTHIQTPSHGASASRNKLGTETEAQALKTHLTEKQDFHILKGCLL